MNLNPQHLSLSLSFRFSWEGTQLTCSSTHGILLEPSVASFGFHLSTKSAMVPQRPRQSLPRWFRPSPGIQGVDYAVMFFLCFHVFLLLKNLTSCFCFWKSSFFSSMSRSCFTSKCGKGHLWSLTGSSSMLARESKVNSILKLHLKLLLDWGDVHRFSKQRWQMIWCNWSQISFHAYHLLR